MATTAERVEHSDMVFVKDLDDYAQNYGKHVQLVIHLMKYKSTFIVQMANKTYQVLTNQIEARSSF